MVTAEKRYRVVTVRLEAWYEEGGWKDAQRRIRSKIGDLEWVSVEYDPDRVTDEPLFGETTPPPPRPMGHWFGRDR